MDRDLTGFSGQTVVEIAWANSALLGALRAATSVLWARWLDTLGGPLHDEYTLAAVFSPRRVTSILWGRVLLYGTRTVDNQGPPCNGFSIGSHPDWTSDRPFSTSKLRLAVVVEERPVQPFYLIIVAKHNNNIYLSLDILVPKHSPLIVSRADPRSFHDAILEFVTKSEHASMIVRSRTGSGMEQMLVFSKARGWHQRLGMKPMLDHNMEAVVRFMLTSRMDLADHLPKYRV